jgi:Leucine-rich repeat (LRR) protein
MFSVKRRPRLRFSLLTLLIAITVLSLWLGWQTFLANRQKAAVDAIGDAEGIVIFADDSRTSAPVPNSEQQAFGERLRESIGLDYFRTAKTVDFATNNGRRRRTREPKVTQQSLDHIASLVDLETLELSHNETIDDDALSQLSGLQKLKTLYLYHTSVEGPGLAHLVALPKLESLSLSRTPLRDEGLKPIGEIGQLRWLQLEHTQITDDGLAHLSRLQKLTDLSLAQTDISDVGLNQLESLTQLAELNLTHTNITAAGVERIRQVLPRCKLYVTFGVGLTPIDLAVFPLGSTPDANELNARFKELGIGGTSSADRSQPKGPITSMHLSQSLLSDKSTLLLLESAPALRHLAVRGALVGDEFATGLAKWKQLEYVELSETHITGAGLKALSELPNLQELVMNNNRLSDDAILHLSALKNLIRLQLENTRISDQAIERLKRALPDCQIY